MELFEKLKKLYLADTPIDGKDFLEVTRLNKKEKEQLANLVEKDYLQKRQEGKKKLYEIGKSGLALLQQNETFWNALTQRKQRLLREKRRELLELVREKNAKKALNVTERKHYQQQISECLADGKITEEKAANRYRITDEGETYLFSLRPAGEIIEALEFDFQALERKVTKMKSWQQTLCQPYQIEQSEIEESYHKRVTKVREHLKDSLQELDEIKAEIENQQTTEAAKEFTRLEIERVKQYFQTREEELHKSLANQKQEMLQAMEEKFQEAQSRIQEQLGRVQEKAAALTKLHLQLMNFLRQEGSLMVTEEELQEEISLSQEAKEELFSDITEQQAVATSKEPSSTTSAPAELESEPEEEQELEFVEQAEENEQNQEQEIELVAEEEQNQANSDEMMDFEVAEDDSFSYEEEKTFSYDEEDEEDDEELLEEIRDFYRLTYFRHRGQLKLDTLLDHLQGREYDREEVKHRMLDYNHDGKLVLKKGGELEHNHEDNVIREGNLVYVSLQIPELMI